MNWYKFLRYIKYKRVSKVYYLFYEKLGNKKISYIYIFIINFAKIKGNIKQELNKIGCL